MPLSQNTSYNEHCPTNTIMLTQQHWVNVACLMGVYNKATQRLYKTQQQTLVAQSPTHVRVFIECADHIWYYTPD